jgi:hypothetical protein
MHFNAIARLDAQQQMKTYTDLVAANQTSADALWQRPDMKRIREATDSDAQLDAYSMITKESRKLWDEQGKKHKLARKLAFSLSLHSSDATVRQRMKDIVDTHINKELYLADGATIGPVPKPPAADVRVPRGAYFRDLLELAKFGGRFTEQRPDVYWNAYEFNAKTIAGYRPAVPWNPIETLYEAGLLKTFGKVSGNNLSSMGRAALARLTERYGPSDIPKKVYAL